jgi:hypothetical protein
MSPRDMSILKSTLESRTTSTLDQSFTFQALVH